MAPWRADHSPAVLALLADGRAGREALASAIVRLGARGWLKLVEKADRRLTLVLETPAQDAVDRLSEDELWLLNALRRWSRTGETPSRDGWLDAVGRQAVAEGALRADEWARLRQRSFWPFLSRMTVPKAKAAAARAAAAALETYPDPEGDFPRSRAEWDEALSLAAALGLAGDFLARARQTNEHLSSLYQGVVATFCTPGWFREGPIEDRVRFAYLTDGLAPALSRWDWTKVDPA
jgi:hypothetical protein